jgi:hypothetical protein
MVKPYCLNPRYSIVLVDGFSFEGEDEETNVFDIGASME